MIPERMYRCNDSSRHVFKGRPNQCHGTVQKKRQDLSRKEGTIQCSLTYKNHFYKNNARPFWDSVFFKRVREAENRRFLKNGFDFRNQLVEICPNPVSTWSGEGWDPPIQKSSGSRRRGDLENYLCLLERINTVCRRRASNQKSRTHFTLEEIICRNLQNMAKIN